MEHEPRTTLYDISHASNLACSLTACDLASHDEREQTWRRPAAAGRRRLVFVHSTSPAPAARRTRVAGGAEEPLLARRIGSSKRRRQDAYAAPRRRRTCARSRRLSLRLRERLCSPARGRSGTLGRSWVRRSISARHQGFDALTQIIRPAVPYRWSAEHSVSASVQDYARRCMRWRP